MKSTYLILGLSAVFSSTAFAADMPAPQPAAPVPVFTWTGLYLGANVGAWFAPTNPSYEAIGFPSAGFGLVPNGGGQNEGATGGFQAGYNYQIGSFVPGLEMDFDYLGNCRGGTFAAPPAYAPFGVGTYSLSGGSRIAFFKPPIPQDQDRRGLVRPTVAVRYGISSVSTTTHSTH